jgi:hypothetical protein
VTGQSHGCLNLESRVSSGGLRYKNWAVDARRPSALSTKCYTFCDHKLETRSDDIGTELWSRLQCSDEDLKVHDLSQLTIVQSLPPRLIFDEGNPCNP